ncbi:hypothetical protein [Brotaphodocola sp.]|uniref:hypothetical protein n=1 Tax=Brotaphodocola sp. TaxID=3073577 RepID=UPI003D7DD9A2
MRNQSEPEKAVWLIEFENLYIVTYQKLYRHAKLIFNQEEKIRELLILTYMEAYQRGEQLQKEKSPIDWLIKREDFLAETKLDASREMLEASHAEEKMQSKEAQKERFSNLDETSLLLEIEDRLGIVDDQEIPERVSVKKTAVQGVFSVALFLVSMGILAVGIWKVKHQIDVLQAPFERKIDLESESEETEDEKKENCIQVGAKAVYLSDNGQVLYSLPLEESEFADSDLSNPEIQTHGGWTYYLPCQEREDSELKNVWSELDHTLYRMSGDADKMDEIEIIARDVDNYSFWEDGIYVSQYDRIQRIGENEIFEKKACSFYAMADGDDIVLYDMLGRTLQTQEDGSLPYEDRVFIMDGNRIAECNPAQREYAGISYFLSENGDGESAIYKEEAGEESLFLEQGKGIDSFCIADGQMYYSVFVRKRDGIQYSEIYRRPLANVGETVMIGERFKGRIMEMSYSKSSGEIYASYKPKSWVSNRGIIAVISPAGQISYLNDEELRKQVETTGNDDLQFVMEQDGEVYCYWTDNNWKRGKEPEPIWRKVLVIPDKDRTFVE